MGLDMYLEKETYVKNWDHYPEDRRHQVAVSRGGQPTAIQPTRVKYIVEEACYWRKANAIHRWFVQNVQDGNDDCSRYYVEREKLRDLLLIVSAVLDAPEKAPDLLPTQSGFFFGNTDYNDWFLEQLRETQKTLTELLAEPDDSGEFYYRSSW